MAEARRFDLQALSPDFLEKTELQINNFLKPSQPVNLEPLKFRNLMMVCDQVTQKLSVLYAEVDSQLAFLAAILEGRKGLIAALDKTKPLPEKIADPEKLKQHLQVFHDCSLQYFSLLEKYLKDSAETRAQLFPRVNYAEDAELLAKLVKLVIEHREAYKNIIPKRIEEYSLLTEKQLKQQAKVIKVYQKTAELYNEMAQAQDTRYEYYKKLSLISAEHTQSRGRPAQPSVSLAWGGFFTQDLEKTKILDSSADYDELCIDFSL